MPIEIGVWKLGSGVQRVPLTHMPSEERLEDILADDLSIIDPGLLLIGRQVSTKWGGVIDLLAIDRDGDLAVIELKRGKTPRDIVAQLFDYASWVKTQTADEIARTFADYQKRFKEIAASVSLDDAFKKHFNVGSLPETLNEDHQLIIVASELDPSTERIVQHMADQYGAAINAVFFRFFKDGQSEFLSRVWLIDPGEAEVKVVEKGGRGIWNGEYYASFGQSEHRSWEDARRFGFISAGGAAWYSRSLDLLEPGGRVWVYAPGYGYVGVGEALEKAERASKFKVDAGNGRQVPALEVLTAKPVVDAPIEQQEHFVRVRWIKTVPVSEAVSEKGFFANQNSVARPRHATWAFTVERLKSRWGIA